MQYFSPREYQRSMLKQKILGLYLNGKISIEQCQLLIDRFRLWEA